LLTGGRKTKSRPKDNAMMTDQELLTAFFEWLKHEYFDWEMNELGGAEEYVNKFMTQEANKCPLLNP
jgi:hypothetical protein